MKYKVLVCDLDGSLFEATKLPIVSDRCKELLVKLQQQGVIIVLNTARIFHGCYPLAKHLELHKYGGYLVCCNGAMVYDMAKEETIFLEDIDRDDALAMWDYAIHEKGCNFAIAQPEYMVTNAEKHGFAIDREACNIDYLCTYYPEKRITAPIWKCAIAMSKEYLDVNFNDLKESMEAKFPYKVVRSAERYVDISRKHCDKVFALNHLFDLLQVKWEDACILGDGNSDAEMIRLAGYGVTLENGSDLCKKHAKRIVPDILEDGCCVLFEELLGE